jgi:hypothetical protein
MVGSGGDGCLYFAFSLGIVRFAETQGGIVGLPCDLLQPLRAAGGEVLAVPLAAIFVFHRFVKLSLSHAAAR